MRKGQQSGVNASYLIAVIAVMFILYVILIPSGEKEALINDPSAVGQGSLGGSSYGQGYGQPTFGPGFITIFSESPGTLYPHLDQTLTKPLPSVHLFSLKQQSEESLAQSLTFSKSIFGGDPKELVLKIPTVQDVEKVQLLFFVLKGEGNIIITLNGKEIFNADPSSANLPIELPRSLIGANNKLVFSVASSNFLSTNTYSIKDVIAVINHKQQHTKEIRTFALNSAERQTSQAATLFYVVNCFTAREQGRLRVSLNGRIIHEGIVVCDAGQSAVDLLPQDLFIGRNILEFEIDNGQFVLEQTHVDMLLGPQSFPSYFFTLQAQEYQAASRGAPVFLKTQFLNKDIRKVGTLFMNGFPIYIDTYDEVFIADITPFVTFGQNTIRLVPTTPLDIISLDVTLG